MQAAVERVGALFAIDLLKKLDSKVAVDLFGSFGAGPPSSSSGSAPQAR